MKTTKEQRQKWRNLGNFREVDGKPIDVVGTLLDALDEAEMERDAITAELDRYHDPAVAGPAGIVERVVYVLAEKDKVQIEAITERDEWKRSAETVATERDHAIRRLQDASDIGKRHAMAEANESANLRVASVIRELRDEIAEKDTAGEKLAQTIACSASASARCALPAGERCNHHTIAALVEERRTLRLELAAQQAEGRTLRAQQHLAAGRVRVPLDIPAFPEWDAEIARGNRETTAPIGLAPACPHGWDPRCCVRCTTACAMPPDLLDALPEHQIPQPERDAPARVLATLTRRPA